MMDLPADIFGAFGARFAAKSLIPEFRHEEQASFL
jgi:hypothetical protein